nr:MAG TPA_asm: hypothetical protein [Caudoviricetes sp.]
MYLLAYLYRVSTIHITKRHYSNNDGDTHGSG